ncbi:putative reverse transcriptase domain-containing protein [Tanacetum coccineum]
MEKFLRNDVAGRNNLDSNAYSKVELLYADRNLSSCYDFVDQSCLLVLTHLSPMKLRVDDKLHFVEKPIEVMDREIKQLKKGRIPIIKVRWNSRRGSEFTWEREDQFKKAYPHLSTKTVPLSSNSS